MRRYRLELPPIVGPFTIAHLSEAERWAAELLAWSRGERADPPAGITPPEG
jgi:hypothetical protein